MRKIFSKMRVMTACMVMTCICFCGCGASTTASQEQTKDAITITFMNGEVQLGTMQANRGEQIDAAAYEAQEGAAFEGWFETPTFLEVSKKDLATDTFDADTTLYGRFQPTDVAEDTRKWYLAGTSSLGTLKENNWADANLEDSVKEQFALKATGNAVNEFSITIDLFAGDQFQVVQDWQWSGQRGFGYITQVDEACMENGGGLSGSANHSNINVLQSGNYTITMTTNPENEALDTFVVVRNGEPLTTGEAEEDAEFVLSEQTNVFVKGSWVADWSELKALDRADSSSQYTITMELSAETELCFSVFEGDTDTGIVLKEENVSDAESKALLMETQNNIKVAADGTYTFLVDVEQMSVTITQ